MKKIVPFKKDISFDTNIYEIHSISLEHQINEKKESLITGQFIISGDYKLTKNSEHLDNFNYELPFDINIDKKYDISKADVDISDFYYELINSKILAVNIELEVDKIEEKKMDRCVEDEKSEVTETTIDKGETQPVKSLFDNLDENEKYVTYKIHIVTENDTIESILTNYSITKGQLEDYNDFADIKIGDKLIIPENEN